MKGNRSRGKQCWFEQNSTLRFLLCKGLSWFPCHISHGINWIFLLLQSKTPAVLALYDDQDPISNQIYVATFAVCGLVAAILVAAVAIFLVRKHSKLVRLSQDDPSFEPCKDYQVNLLGTSFRNKDVGEGERTVYTKQHPLQKFIIFFPNNLTFTRKINNYLIGFLVGSQFNWRNPKHHKMCAWWIRWEYFKLRKPK